MDCKELEKNHDKFVEKIKNIDTQTYDCLKYLYEGIIRSHIHKYANGIPETDYITKNVFTDTILVLAEKLTFDHDNFKKAGNNIRAFFRAVSRNKVFDHLTYYNHNFEIPTFIDENGYEYPKDIEDEELENNPLENLISKEEKELMDKAIKHCLKDVFKGPNGERDADIFLKYSMDSDDYNSLLKKWGITYDNARAIFSRSKRAMRDCCANFLTITNF